MGVELTDSKNVIDILSPLHSMVSTALTSRHIEHFLSLSTKELLTPGQENAQFFKYTKHELPQILHCLKQERDTDKRSFQQLQQALNRFQANLNTLHSSFKEISSCIKPVSEKFAGCEDTVRVAEYLTSFSENWTAVFASIDSGIQGLDG